MPKPRFAHHNNCPRCPIIGAEDIPGEEYFDIWGMRFSIAIARKIAAGHPLIGATADNLEQWLAWAHIEKQHLDHVPTNKGFGIVITLPFGIGMPMIDGNHRTLTAVINRKRFSVAVLNEEESLEILRRSMGTEAADELWQDMRGHPSANQTQSP
jgi:hypothetical protein